jgi:hypothetical protein
VHRAVTDDCVSCHPEHAGRDAKIRHFDKASFNHAEETGFAFDGKHAALAKECAKCHKEGGPFTFQQVKLTITVRDHQPEPRIVTFSHTVHSKVADC